MTPQEKAKEILLSHLAIGHEEIEVSFHPRDIDLMVAAILDYANQQGQCRWVDIIDGNPAPTADVPTVFEMSDGEVYKGVYQEDCGNWWVSLKTEGGDEFDRENFSLNDFTRYLDESPLK